MILFYVFWVICGVFAYGFSFAHMQRSVPEIAEQNYKKDMFYSFLTGCLGPLGLIFIFITKSYKYGLKFR